VIFPNLLHAIGLIEFVINKASEYEDTFNWGLYYQLGISEEDLKEYFGEHAVRRYKKFTKLTIDDYEYSFEVLTEFLKEMEKGRYAEKLRDLSFTVDGYCKLNDINYEETQRKIARRYEVAYQSFL